MCYSVEESVLYPIRKQTIIFARRIKMGGLQYEISEKDREYL